MSDIVKRKIDAIDQFEVDIVEAGIMAWKRNRGGELSNMTVAWRTMARMAIDAQNENQTSKPTPD